MIAFELFLIAWALLGHLAVWVAIYNRLHATPLPRSWIHAIEKVIFLFVVAVPSLAIAILPWPLRQLQDPTVWTGGQFAALLFALVYWLKATTVSLHWLRRRLTDRPPLQLESNDTVVVDVAAELGYRPIGDRLTRIMDRVPGNQILQLSIHEKTLRLPRLAASLDGLRIVHISDLHLAGQLQRGFFDVLVQRANALDADLVAITGDLVDEAEFVPWLPELLGQLQSRYGAYFVLGNHDKRIADVPGLRRTLTDAGVVDMGGRCLEVQVRDQKILLAGNELPWFGPAPEVPPFEPAAPLRVLLAHTPDQLPWAQQNEFDLMLAGHTHGGQIRVPAIGPIVSPSYFGVDYASGTFFQPPTLMHVSRGLSGLQAIRINCPPELACLVLRSVATEKRDRPLS